MGFLKHFRHRVIAAKGLLTGKFSYATVVYIDRYNLEKLLMNKPELDIDIEVYCTTHRYISAKIIQAANQVLNANSMDATLARLQFEAEAMDFAEKRNSGFPAMTKTPCEEISIKFKDWCDLHTHDGLYNGEKMTNAELYKLFRNGA